MCRFSKEIHTVHDDHHEQLLVILMSSTGEKTAMITMKAKNINSKREGLGEMEGAVQWGGPVL